MSGMLEGVRVLDFGQFIAAPAATQILADMGADVIKIESAEGDSARALGVHGVAMFNAFNRGKRSVVLDLKSEEGFRIADELIAKSDIVVQNLRPGAMEKLGLGPEDVLARHPHIVYASISGFGTRGPSRNRPGLDIAAQAESGIMHSTGEADGEPQKVGAQFIDAATGHAVAASVLGAYVQRLRTGKGEILEASLLEVAIHLQAPMYGAYLATGVEPRRMGNGQPTVAPAADLMTTSDGAFVVSAASQAHFARLCEVIGRPDLTTDERFATNMARVQNKADLLANLRAAFAEMTTADAVAKCSANGVVTGRINTYADVVVNPDVVESGIFVTVGSGDDEASVVGHPVTFRGTPRSRRGAPEVGQHTDEVLTELGLHATA